MDPDTGRIGADVRWHSISNVPEWRSRKEPHGFRSDEFLEDVRSERKTGVYGTHKRPENSADGKKRPHEEVRNGIHRELREPNAQPVDLFPLHGINDGARAVSFLRATTILPLPVARATIAVPEAKPPKCPDRST